MFSFCVSLLSMGTYAVVDFIRSSSPTGTLAALGSLFFVLGTFLRRHLTAAQEPATSYRTNIWERSARGKSYRDTLEKVAISYSSAGQAQPVSRERVSPDEIGFAQLDRSYIAPSLTK
ncbi:MAG TPA: hypothetical protein VFB14_15075 [Bryobacteraceae bacterium]|jgi:hypothetical protein|nr:hypothetical protein [Bryobacteraceae bacterium]